MQQSPTQASPDPVGRQVKPEARTDVDQLPSNRCYLDTSPNNLDPQTTQTERQFTNHNLGLQSLLLRVIGPPVVPFYPFVGEGSPTKLDYIKKGTLILTSQIWRTWGI